MRKLYFFIILIIFQSFLTSCKFEVDKELKGKGAAQNEPSARIESLDRKAQDSSPDLNPSTSIDGLKEGMVYGQLRRIVISSGWRPKVNPDCKKTWLVVILIKSVRLIQVSAKNAILFLS
ncbi:hypothetical protein [Xanthomonas vasicola]|uniref:hypothetical protein n=1 Tax=Xanthomonas vasicola TaxID=56459 RepID=UPI001015F55C|nr:hypothetical protein [Xanthomonas vasicola]